MKNKFTIIGIVTTTIILAGIAIFTAVKLYQTRYKIVAPNIPSSRPSAQEIGTTPSTCQLNFTISTTAIVENISTGSPSSSPSPTATSTIKATGTASPTATSTATSTIKATGTASPTATSTTAVKTSTPTTEPSLPNAGTTWPTIFGVGFGLLIIVGSLLLAL